MSKIKKGGAIILTAKDLENIALTHKVVTSNDLIVKTKLPHLTRQEQRLVLYMLAMIEKHDEDFKTYEISVKELGKILGLKHKNMYKEFDKATDGLMTKIIRWIEAPNDVIDVESYPKCAWCSSARLIPKKGYVTMRFDPSLKPFLLELKNNFTQYELRAVFNLKNHYSLRIYQIIKVHQGKYKENAAILDIAWLKEYLSIPEKEYKLNNDFTKRVVAPAKKDISANTDIQFKYELLKQEGSRKYTHIKFTWKPNPKYNQMSLFPPDIEKKLNELPPEPTPMMKQIMELGFRQNDAKNLLHDHSEDVLNIVLDDLNIIFEKKKEAGQKIENLAGYFLKLLPKPGQDYVPSNYYKQDKELRDKQEKEKKKEALKNSLKKLEDEYYQYYSQMIDKKISSLPEETKTDMLEKFEMEGLSNLYEKKVFKEQGLENSFIKSAFVKFYSKYSDEPFVDMDFNAFAASQGHDLDKLKSALDSLS